MKESYLSERRIFTVNFKEILTKQSTEYTISKRIIVASKKVIQMHVIITRSKEQ